MALDKELLSSVPGLVNYAAKRALDDNQGFGETVGLCCSKDWATCPALLDCLHASNKDPTYPSCGNMP